MLFNPCIDTETTTQGLHGLSVRWGNEVKMIRYLKTIIWGHPRAYRKPNRFGPGRPMQTPEQAYATSLEFERVQHVNAYFEAR